MPDPRPHRLLAALLGAGMLTLGALAAQPGTDTPGAAQPGAAQPGAGKPAEPPAEAPKLELDRTALDFGEVTDQDILKGEIKFKNVGKTSLIIIECKPSCGCVRPKLRGDKKEYGPGEEGVIEVQFEPLNKQGPLKDLNISVRSNDAGAPSQRIEVKGDVKPTVGVDSPDGLSLGSIEAGSAKSLTFYIFGRLPTFKATFATISAEDGFSVKIGETVEVERKGEKVQRTAVTVTAESGARVGKFSHSVVIRHTDKRIRNGLWELPITGEVLNDVRTEPVEIDLGALGMTEDYTHPIKLTNVKGASFKILESRFTPTKGGPLDIKIEGSATDKPGTLDCKVSGKTPARPGPCEGFLQVRTDLKGMPPVRILVKLTVRQPT